ncbi:molecular chaperone, partial [Pseudomonas sp. KB_15]
MHVWRWLSFLIAATVGLVSIPAQAAIVITGTRVIYPEKSRQVSVRLNNVEDTPVLVQAWIDDGDTSVPVEKLDVPFIITPPVF